MTKEITINGMMCQMCEKHVRTALENLEGVTAVTRVSHEDKVAVIECNTEISEDTIRNTITEAGYEFVSVK